MVVEPTVTRVVPSQVIPPAGLGSNIFDPRTRSAQALVRIRQGDTLVMGGLIDRNEDDTIRQVPVLSGIPVIGEAFKNTQVNNASTELIVFVTPHILNESQAAQVASVVPPGPWEAAQAGKAAPMTAREQDEGGSRQDLIERTLNRLEQPSL